MDSIDYTKSERNKSQNFVIFKNSNSMLSDEKLFTTMVLKTLKVLVKYLKNICGNETAHPVCARHTFVKRLRLF